MKGHFKSGLIPYAPLRAYVGTADIGISPQECAELVDASRAQQANITLKIYPGASRQDIAANAAATRDATTEAIAFFASRSRR